MNFGLLAPLGLVALVALAVPVLIHLVRRLELKSTEFAALRWVGERVRPQRRLRIERPLLLALRLLLLALLAILLARPVWTIDATAARSWIVVAPGVTQDELRGSGEWHWLAPGFPSIDTAARLGDAAPPADVPLASLLRELDARLPRRVALTVIVPRELAGLDGERPRLSRPIDWRVVAGRMPAAPAPVARPVTLAVRPAPGNEAALRYLRAAVAVWNQREPDRYTLDVQPLNTPIGSTTDWLVWLAPSAPGLAQWIENGGTALATQMADTKGEVLWRDGAGRVLARVARQGNGRLIALGGSFLPDELPILLDGDFPERMRRAFAPPPAAPAAAEAAAVTPRFDESLSGTYPDARDALRPLDHWLAILIAILFLLERILATRWRRVGAA
jgi:hypothetical protein